APRGGRAARPGRARTTEEDAMTDLTDRCLVPGLALLADWSVRWGLLLAALALWFLLRTPRRAATRHLLCALALASGMLLPLAPRWASVRISWPRERAASAVAPASPSPLPRLGPTPSRVLAGEVSRPAGRMEAIVRPVASPPAPLVPRPGLGAWRLSAL